MTEKNASWLERVEEIIQVLEGSSVGELELSEGDTEIIIRRQPEMVLVSSSSQVGAVASFAGGATAETARGAARVEKSVAINAPLTGVYYSAASPTTPPFVNVGENIHVGQVVALVEAMKVFNEITAEVAGRVTALVATNGSVVQKGEALLRVEPL